MTSLPLAHAKAFMCFSMFDYTRARFRFALIGGNLTAQSTGSHRGIPETQLQALLPFPATLPERPGELARRLHFALFIRGLIDLETCAYL